VSVISPAVADPAVTVLGKDYIFPNKIAGLPGKLSDFADLQINTFKTNDGVKLSYWEAGKGRPLIFIPGWSANGAEYVNVMYLLSKRYHIYVLDPRNQGLSQQVDYGTRISRFGADLKDLVDHLGLKSADFCGWSMGASVLWSYIDLYGTGTIRKAVFIDEPLSIYSHADWSEQERRDAGAITSSPERMIAAFTGRAPTNSLYVDSRAFERSQLVDSPYFVNSESFAREFVKNDIKYMSLVLFDHATGDWRDVVRRKINVPTAIFTGEHSDSPSAQKWLHAAVPGSEFFYYAGAEQGDHFLAFKNPLKFTQDLSAFLER
jgi:pimeloyl-ACP methyl ester carboxylesterase